jgi:hypothetical protein
MTIASKLGPQYEAIRASARLKSIQVELNDVQFELKVRVPVKREMDEITALLTTPNAELIEQKYKELSEPLRKTIAETDEGFLDVLNSDGEKIKFTDDDVIVNNTSIRQIASLTTMWQKQVEVYFGLLHTSTGEPVNESYDEIAEEFPESVIREIIKKIDEAIRPSYKDAKKN